MSIIWQGLDVTMLTIIICQTVALKTVWDVDIHICSRKKEGSSLSFSFLEVNEISILKLC